MHLGLIGLDSSIQYIDPAVPRISKVGGPLPEGTSVPEKIAGLVALLPIRQNGSEGNWQWYPETLRERLLQGRVRVGGSFARGFVIYILKDGEYAKLQRREFQEFGRDADGSIIVERNDASFVRAVPGTQWRVASHDATQYGSRLLGEILPDRRFPFPKSLYAVRDTLRFFVEEKPDALVVDFFAGSGTSLNALSLLNAVDGGQRRCILVTNNEVSAEEAEQLRLDGLQPGSEEWETEGICRAVTWPRCKFIILGRRDDGSGLRGDYRMSGRVEHARPRRVTHIGFVDPDALDRPAQKKQLVALIDGLPQTLVKDPCPFIVSEDHKASVLFDDDAAKDWLAALEGQEHITDLYIVTPTKKRFDALKAEVQALLGPILVPEEEKRPMADGFPANMAYFKLDFLDNDRVALKRAFREILPLLWLKAGALGPRPELKPADSELPFFAPPENPFAVLLDEGSLKRLLAALAGRVGLRCVYLVTDSEDAFKEMAAEVAIRLGADNPALETVQLYRDYLDNFLINTDRLGMDGQGGAR